MQQITIRDALQQSGRDIDDIDTRILLQYVLNVSQTHLIAHAGQALDEKQVRFFRLLTERRAQGEPVPYLLGKREFYSLDFTVTPAVLIPRPETELLVDLALARIPQDIPWKILDLGTGSGAIALTIAKYRPLPDITGVDFSVDALAVAKTNADQLNVSNVRFIEADWFGGVVGERFDLIVSNPPYVACGDPHLAQGDLRFEPRMALVAEGEGLGCIRSIIAAAPAYLVPGGALLLEHGYDQAEACRQLLSEAGFEKIFSRPDIAGIVRVSGASVIIA